MLQKFDMNLLIVFHTLMEERSVTRAGERLARTQSAISNSLKRLRFAFDDPLFVRDKTGLAPTPRAEALAPRISQIIHETEACLYSDRDIDIASAEAHFKIGAPDRLSQPVFLPFLQDVRRFAPHIRIDLRTADSDVAINLLADGEIDLALGWFDDVPPQIARSVAFSEELVCLCRTDHPIICSETEADLPRILSFPHVMVSSGGAGHAAFDAMLAQAGYQRNIETALTNFTLVPNLLSTTDMIGVFTKRTADYFADNHDLATRPVPLEIAPISHEMIWHRRFDNDPAHIWIREQLHSACE